ncbi:MAG: DNA polymerase III subunit delta [Christensenellales bacterium]
MRAFEINDNLKYGVGAIYSMSGNDYGLENYAIQAVKNKLRSQGEVEVFNYDPSTPIVEVIANANSFSLFGAKKLITYYIGKSKEKTKLEASEVAAVVDYAHNPNEDCVLILRECGDVFACIKEYCVVVDCNKGNWDEVSRYIATAFSRRGYEIERAAIKGIVNSCGLDMVRIPSEVAKLLLYCQDTKRVTAHDVEEITTVDAENKMFDLSNALQRGDNQQALELMDSMLKRDVKPSVLLSTVASSFRKQFLIANTNATDEVISKTLGLSQSALGVNKSIVANGKKKVKGYVPRLKKIVDELAELEYKFKNGVFSDESALLLAMTKLLSKKESV